MSQYIDVATPEGQKYYKNLALEKLLAFLGQKDKKAYSGKRVQMQTDYKAGLDFMNRKCRKGYKTTINNLLKSKHKQTTFSCEYRNWKFHKRKAERFFRILYQELKRTNANNDVWQQFDALYTVLSNDFSIDKCGSHIISCPYHSALNQVKSDSKYSFDDRKAIAKVVKAFPLYDELYFE